MGPYEIRSEGTLLFSTPSDGNLYISIQQLGYKCRPGQGIMAD